MFVSGFVSFMAGLLLGARFKVGILIPAIVTILVAQFALGRWIGQALPLMIASGILALTALQAGYVCGAFSAARSPMKLGQPDGVPLRDSR
jgi:hypothetical protein